MHCMEQARNKLGYNESNLVQMYEIKFSGWVGGRGGTVLGWERGRAEIKQQIRNLWLLHLF